MEITSSIIDRAVARLFAGQPERNYSLLELGDRWYDTGLRSADLREGLDRLSDQGYVTCDTTAGTATYCLTPLGHESLFGAERGTTTAQEEALLQRLSHRTRSGYRPEMRRRACDHAGDPTLFDPMDAMQHAADL